MTFQIATIEINGDLFGLSTIFGIEEVIQRALEQHESITVTYRESDNLIVNVAAHDKSV